MRKNEFDFEMYLDSMSQMKKMGGLSSVMGMMPGTVSYTHLIKAEYEGLGNDMQQMDERIESLRESITSTSSDVYKRQV